MSSTFITYFLIFSGFALLLISEAIGHASKSLKFEDILCGRGDMNTLIRKHLFASVVLGFAILFLNLLLKNENRWLLPAGNDEWFVIWIIAMFAAFFAGSFAAKEKLRGFYKSTPVIFLPGHLTNYYFLSRALFLIVYEFFFRGVLLENMIKSTGIILAIIINIIFYALAHAFSNKKEIIGTIPFGFLLCIITIHLQSVWPATGIHLVLSFAYEIKLSYRYSHFIKKMNT
ncbi:MAG: CPBP family intramembrane glutamic endopeptidase [Chitinophagaceae bacterium]